MFLISPELRFCDIGEPRSPQSVQRRQSIYRRKSWMDVHFSPEMLFQPFYGLARSDLCVVGYTQGFSATLGSLRSI
jgi:hypothetical protein